MPLANCSGDRPRAVGHREGATTTRRRGFHADRCRSVPEIVRARRDPRNGDNVRMSVPPGVEPARRGPTGGQYCETRRGPRTQGVPGRPWRSRTVARASRLRGDRCGPTIPGVHGDTATHAENCPWSSDRRSEIHGGLAAGLASERRGGFACVEHREHRGSSIVLLVTGGYILNLYHEWNTVPRCTLPNKYTGSIEHVWEGSILRAYK